MQFQNLSDRVMAKTLFDKIWEAHVVQELENGPTQLYIDRHFIHEVTSPQAFGGLDKRGIKVFRPEQTFATCDHNTPTLNQDKPIGILRAGFQLRPSRPIVKIMVLSIFR